MKALTSEEFDNLRAILTSLRIDCEGVTKIDKAIEIISEKLDLEPQVVKDLLIRVYN